MRHVRRRYRLVGAIVEERIEPRLDRHLHVVAGAGNDIEIGLKVLMKNQFAAVRAFDPQVFRRLAAQKRADFRRDDVGNPVHASPLQGRRAAPRLASLFVWKRRGKALDGLARRLADASGKVTDEIGHGGNAPEVARPSSSRDLRNASTSAEPTTTPSATLAMAAALSHS